MALITHCLDVARALGAHTVGLKAGNPKEGMSADEAERLMVETISKVAGAAGERRIYLALENGGTVTNDHTRSGAGGEERGG